MSLPLKKSSPAGLGPRGLLLLLTLLYVDTFIGRQTLAVMVEPIKHEFNVSDTAMGMVTGLAFAAVYALFGLAAGQLADRKPRIHIIVACTFLWSLATFLCGLTTGLYLLIATRMLVAVAETPLATSAVSLITDLYPPQKRAFAISCYSSAPTFATIIAMSVGAWIVDHWGWRQAFFLVAIPSTVIGLIFLLFTREPVRGLWESSAQPAAASSLKQGVASLLSQPDIRLLMSASALATLAANAYGMWNAAFLVRSYDLPLQHAGILTGVAAGGSAAVGMLLSGWLSDKLTERTSQHGLLIPLLGHFLGLISLWAYLLWPQNTLFTVSGIAVPEAMIWCVLNGFFSVWWVGPCMSYLTQLAPLHQRGLAVALQTVLIILLGVGLGPFLVGVISDLLSPYLAHESLRYALLLSSGSILITLFMLLRIQSQSRNNKLSGYESTVASTATPTSRIRSKTTTNRVSPDITGDI